jgi:hypothetical protein
MARPKGSGPTPSSFKPGQSGNPGGRPAVVKEVRELAKTYTVEAIETLAAIMRDTSANPGSRVAAANSLLDRGHGKAPQTYEVANYDVLTDAELDRIIVDTIAKLRAIGAEGAALAIEASGGGGKKVSKH